MKKLISSLNFLAILSLITATGCKKDKVAFPTQPATNGNYPEYTYRAASFPTIPDADGMLIAVKSYNYHIITISPFEQEFEYGMAQFTNTTGNFSSPTNADSVWVNGTNLTKASDNTYLSSITTPTLNFSGNITWNVKGAGSVAAMTNTISGGTPKYSYGQTKWASQLIPTYPKALTVITLWPHTGGNPWPTNPLPPFPTHNDSVLVYGISSPQPNHTDSTRWINDSATFNSALATYKKTKAQHIADSTYNVTPFASLGIKNYVTNADSILIIFNDGANFNYVKKVLPTDSLANFIPNDFAGYPGFNQATLTLQVNLLKYNTVMVGTKKYYYIKMGSYIKYWKNS